MEFTPRRSSRLASRALFSPGRALETHKVAVSKQKNKAREGNFPRPGRGWKVVDVQKTLKRKWNPPKAKNHLGLGTDIPKPPAAPSDATQTEGEDANISWPEWFSDGPLTPLPDPNKTLDGRAFTWNGKAYHYQPPGKFTDPFHGETRAPVSDFLDHFVPGPIQIPQSESYLQVQPSRPGGPQRLARTDTVATNATEVIPEPLSESPPKAEKKKGRGGRV